MPIESRTRITLILPLPFLLREFFLLNAVLTDLTQLCGGISTTSMFWHPGKDPVIQGWWYDSNKRKTVEDSNVLVFGDVLLSATDDLLQDYLDHLKATCQEDFEQDIVWITLHQVERITTADPESAS
jgi:hypothetical protein